MNEPKGSTDRKPALEVHEWEIKGQACKIILPESLPPAILALTAPELAALAVFAEAMPHLLADWGQRHADPIYICTTMDAALAAAKEATHD